jgi:hypothetical protein
MYNMKNDVSMNKFSTFSALEGFAAIVSTHGLLVFSSLCRLCDTVSRVVLFSLYFLLHLPLF